MTRCVSIPPEGPLTISDSEPRALAAIVLRTDMLDVVTARGLGRDRIYVMHVDDWGATKPLTLNRRAWALYGASPLYGCAVLSADDGGPIDRAVLDLIVRPDFPSPEVHAAMDQWLEENR